MFIASTLQIFDSYILISLIWNILLKRLLGDYQWLSFWWIIGIYNLEEDSKIKNSVKKNSYFKFPPSPFIKFLWEERERLINTEYRKILSTYIFFSPSKALCLSENGEKEFHFPLFILVFRDDPPPPPPLLSSVCRPRWNCAVCWWAGVN